MNYYYVNWEKEIKIKWGERNSTPQEQKGKRLIYKHDISVSMSATHFKRRKVNWKI